MAGMEDDVGKGNLEQCQGFALCLTCTLTPSVFLEAGCGHMNQF
jgi:hypothetical protein